jgi:hypothetical protein
MAWMLTVSTAINIAAIPAKTKTHTLILVLYTKSCNHRCIKYQAIGLAIISAIKTSLTKSLLIMVVISVTLAPNTLRIPIFLVRRWAKIRKIKFSEFYDAIKDNPKAVKKVEYRISKC